MFEAYTERAPLEVAAPAYAATMRLSAALQAACPTLRLSATRAPSYFLEILHSPGWLAALRAQAEDDIISTPNTPR